MATVSHIRAAADTGWPPVSERGWRRGFANLLRNESRMGWRTRTSLVHLLLWPVVLNGLILREEL